MAAAHWRIRRARADPLPLADMGRMRDRLLSAARHVGAAPRARFWTDGSKALQDLAAAVGVPTQHAFNIICPASRDWAIIVASNPPSPPSRHRPGAPSVGGSARLSDYVPQVRQGCRRAAGLGGKFAAAKASLGGGCARSAGWLRLGCWAALGLIEP